MTSFFPVVARSLAFFLLLCLPHVHSDPAVARFTECFDEDGGVTPRLQISTVYAQVLQNNDLGNYLNLTVLGSSPQPILGFTNTSGSLGKFDLTVNCSC